MKTFIRTTLTVAATIVALTLVGCGKNNSSGPKAMRGTAAGGGAPNVHANSTQNPGSWGNISPTSQLDIVNFLSSGSVQVGNVMSQPCTTALGEQCQVDFNVAVNPGGQQYQALPLVQMGQNQFQTSSGGTLTVAVYDSLTGSPSGGTQLSAIGAPADLVSGQMVYSGNGGYAYLVFKNSAGTVSLGYPPGQSPNGQQNITGEQFSDDITYQYNGVQGILGHFTTNICYVFACQ